MPERPSTQEAVSVLEAQLRAVRQPLDGLSTEDAWRAFLRFGRQRFDTPDRPDADGLLFQYGKYALGRPASFVVVFTRQFEIVDSDGDHDHFVQVHCELRYGPAAALQKLGGFGSWFFHDTEDNIDNWAEELSGRADWTVIAALRPIEVKVYRESA